MDTAASSMNEVYKSIENEKLRIINGDINFTSLIQKDMDENRNYHTLTSFYKSCRAEIEKETSLDDPNLLNMIITLIKTNPLKDFSSTLNIAHEWGIGAFFIPRAMSDMSHDNQVDSFDQSTYFVIEPSYDDILAIIFDSTNTDANDMLLALIKNSFTEVWGGILKFDANTLDMMGQSAFDIELGLYKR